LQPDLDWQEDPQEQVHPYPYHDHDHRDHGRDHEEASTAHTTMSVQQHNHMGKQKIEQHITK
jgi:hypothetical protein